MPPTLPPLVRLPLPERTVALLLQGALWLLMAVFFWFWFKRPNYYIAGNLWPLVLLFMSFALVLFNSLVYWIIRAGCCAAAGYWRCWAAGRWWWCTGSGFTTAQNCCWLFAPWA